MELFGLPGIGDIQAGDDLAGILLAALDGGGRELLDGDIVVVSSKVVSKSEGRAVPGATRDAAILSETVRRVAARRTPRGLAQIVQSAAGPVMAAAGVDNSNVTPGTVLLLPKDPDASARDLRRRLIERTGARIGVILSDTAGRAWRDGQVDFALGAAGVPVTDDLRGVVDTHGQPLEVTVRAVADELAAAADLVKGKLTGVPAVLIRGAGLETGIEVTAGDGPGAAVLLRAARDDWFRLGHVEAVAAALGADPDTLEPPTIPQGSPEARFARAVALALRTPTPWTTAPAEFIADLQGTSCRVTLTLATTQPLADRQQSPDQQQWAALGALAQRICAAAWAEDLTVTTHLHPSPRPALHLTANPSPGSLR